MKMEKGTRIYTTGDMANPSGNGTITRAYSDKWGSFVDIEMDDGRKINHIYTAQFSEKYSGSCSTRFVTLEAYEAYREEKKYLR